MLVEIESNFILTSAVLVMFEAKLNRQKNIEPREPELKLTQAILLYGASEGDANMLTPPVSSCPIRLFIFSTRNSAMS